MLMYVWRFERVAVIMSTAPFARCFLAKLGRQDEDAAVISPRLERKQSVFFYLVSSRSAEGTVSFFGGTWRRDFFFFFVDVVTMVPTLSPSSTRFCLSLCLPALLPLDKERQRRKKMKYHLKEGGGEGRRKIKLCYYCDNGI